MYTGQEIIKCWEGFRKFSVVGKENSLRTIINFDWYSSSLYFRGL